MNYVYVFYELGSRSTPNDFAGLYEHKPQFKRTTMQDATFYQMPSLPRGLGRSMLWPLEC